MIDKKNTTNPHSEHNDRFHKIGCSVREVARSGDLWTLGACVHQLARQDYTNERLMESWLRNYNTLVLVPDCASQEIEQQAQSFLRAAKNVGIKNCVLISITGADERDLKIPQMFGRIEDLLKQ